MGRGLQYLGADVREIEPDTSMTTSTGAIGEIQGFPPTVTQALHPIAGYRVTQECSREEAQPASNAPSLLPRERQWMIGVSQLA